ncbi:molecular chaperone-like protein [Planomonospora sphaerica]|uniref:Molecular chaperone-like protein n=1 Tax=Planomonospora sphaerica TaxID=161355 RepID=A0A171DHZ6_9ACTN|nr:Hsp70 family protein [Planomonospora sphaerica]GAT68592.1 molecular chaperone-like protein [Planomonospora sphaerica]
MAQWCLGVDLGTSFSAGVIAAEGRFDVLEVEGERRIPSAVMLDERGTLVAGRIAQRGIGVSPERVERNPKRYVGRGRMLLGGVPVDVTDAMAALLELFVSEGRRRFDGADPDCIALTHPVAWSAERKAVLLAAAKKVVRGVRIAFVDEPVASARYFASSGRVPSGSHLAVYDLGGGTFDAAVLTADGSDFKVVGEPGGSDEIGGEGFDEQVFAFFGTQLERIDPEWWTQVTTNPERRYVSYAADLLKTAREAKETLSKFETSSHYVVGVNEDVQIDRAELGGLIGEEITRTADILEETIRGAGIGPDELAAVFMTGGGSRMPSVQQAVRDRFGDKVRTYDDPKIVVAYGAAQLAWKLKVEHREPGRTTGPHPAGGPSLRPAGTTGGHPVPVLPVAPAPAPAPAAPGAAGDPAAGHRSSTGPMHVPAGHRAASGGAPAVDGPTVKGVEKVMDHVLEARAAGGRVLVHQAFEGGHFLRRLDGVEGRHDRELHFGRLVEWAASGEGVVTTEQVGPAQLLVRALTPELGIRSTHPLQTWGNPTVLAHGRTGWVFYQSRQTVAVDAAVGLPWGETGQLAMIEIDLGGGFFFQEPQPRDLGPYAQWFVNEDNRVRRLVDQDSPSGTDPALSVGAPGCTVVLGQFSSNKPLFANRHQDFRPWQVLCLVDPGGVVRPTMREPGRSWLHQVVLHNGRWFTASSAGLEADTAAGRPALVAPRPPAGALRWVPAGGSLYAVGADQVSPARGWSVSILDERSGALRFLMGKKSAALAGHLTSRYRWERPRLVADGDSLWLTMLDAGRSRLVHVTPEGAREVHRAAGTFEPVVRVPTGLLCLHRPTDPAGATRDHPATLVHLPL